MAGAENTTNEPMENKDKDEELDEVLKVLRLDSDSDIEPFSSSSDEDSDSDSDSGYEEGTQPGEAATAGAGTGAEPDAEAEDDNTPESNIRRFSKVLRSRRVKRREEDDDEEYVYHEDLFDFPRDRERWTEEDLEEYWADAPLDMTKPGWDPVWADEEDWEVVRDEIKAGRDPPIAPFYVPYRKCYPAIPDNHYDISNPKSVVEELDRIEEFLKWVSYIFPDGSSYEGTVWDDLAHGKGVYVADQGLVRYEGEWLQNAMDGHGVVEVDIPDIQPRPGSKLEAKMRAEGKIITRDFMSVKDREWLEMDIEDSICLADGRSEIPYYESDEWIKLFGQKPEKGRYKYAGQWKQGRMHGCGVYEVNERIIYGRFYFGEHLEDSARCDADVSALHAGIAEVAAAKARMFVNKPDGMVREERGPYGDPQHPYFYEEEDVWMAPGFINQFYEAPDYWKTYVEEVDKEREMWLNSFHKSPLRIPMPAELEYWWEKDESPEFVLINKEPEPDPEDPSKLIYTEDPLILHTRTGRIINYVDDEKYGIRLFWQPPLKEGEDVDPDKAEFLPLGFDEFYGTARPVAKKESWFMRLITSVENAIKPTLDRLEKWTDEKKKASEMNLKLIQQELELVEAEICLEEEMEDLEAELKEKQKEEEKRSASQPDLDDFSVSAGADDAISDGEEEEEDEEAPSSFGTVPVRDGGQGTTKDDKKGNQPKQPPFSSLSMSFGSFAVASAIPTKIEQSFLLWKGVQAPTAEVTGLHVENFMSRDRRVSFVSYPHLLNRQTTLRAVHREQRRLRRRYDSYPQLNGLARIQLDKSTKRPVTRHLRNMRSESLGRSRQLDIEKYPLNIMSLHIPIDSPQWTNGFTL